MEGLEVTRNELDDIKVIMKSNVDKIVLRGENLNELHASCEDLEIKAVQFQTTSKKLERKMCTRKIKYQLAIAIVILTFFLVLIILVLIYFLVIKH